jgi:hypothetical protein
MRLFVIVVEVKNHAVALELEDLLYVEAVDHPLQVNVVLPLLALRLKLALLCQFVDGADVVPEVLLIYLLVKDCVLTGEDGLRLFVEVFDLVFDSVVDALVEDSEYVELLPNIDLDVFEIFLCLEEVPVLEILEVFLLHQFLQSAQQLQQLFY